MDLRDVVIVEQYGHTWARCNRSLAGGHPADLAAETLSALRKIAAELSGAG